MTKIHLAAEAQQVQMQRVQNAEGDSHASVALLLMMAKLEASAVIEFTYGDER